jgi:phenylpyruvate tautomerase PptA (4-oxalocrotonate tautomerase family)
VMVAVCPSQVAAAGCAIAAGTTVLVSDTVDDNNNTIAVIIPKTRGL